MQTVIDQFGWTFTVGFCLLFGIALGMMLWAVWTDWIRPKARPPVPARPVPGSRHLSETQNGGER